jgi:hypothetical protein
MTGGARPSASAGRRGEAGLQAGPIWAGQFAGLVREGGGAAGGGKRRGTGRLRDLGCCDGLGRKGRKLRGLSLFFP